MLLRNGDRMSRSRVILVLLRVPPFTESFLHVPEERVSTRVIKASFHSEKEMRLSNDVSSRILLNLGCSVVRTTKVRLDVRDSVTVRKSKVTSSGSTLPIKRVTPDR